MTKGIAARVLKRILALVMVTAIFLQTGIRTAAAAGRPWEDSSMTFAADKNIPSLRDDFYGAVNDSYIASQDLTEGSGAVSRLTDLQGIMDDRLTLIMTDPAIPGHDAELVRKAYALIDDWDDRNRLGLTPALPYIQRIEQIDSLDDVTSYFSDPEQNITAATLAPFALSVSPDDSSRYTIAISQPVLTLGDSAEYLSMTANGRAQLDYNNTLAAYLMKRLGYSDEQIQDILTKCWSLEAALAPHMASRMDTYATDYRTGICNHYKKEDLQALSGSYPLTGILDAWGYGKAADYTVYDPDLMAVISSLYSEEHVPEIKAYILVRTLLSMTGILDRDTMETALQTQERIYGQSDRTEDGEYAFLMTSGWLSGPMDSAYRQTFLTEEIKADVRNLTLEVITSYQKMMQEEDWLSASAREYALRKLDAIRLNCVYPDSGKDYSDLTFPSREEGGNLLILRNILRNYNLSKRALLADTRVSREWDQEKMRLTEVNAYYELTSNSIDILSGILNGAIYSPDMSYEEKLAGIGTIVGHEISHAFDTGGAQYGLDGSLCSWWTPEDQKAFGSRANRLVAYLDGISPDTDFGQVNGQQVAIEMIADLAGMKCALATASRHPGFDYDLFFRSYASIYARAATPAEEWTMFMTDGHPLNYIRCNGVLQQYQEFYDTYGIEEGDGMYLAPQDRVEIW